MNSKLAKIINKLREKPGRQAVELAEKYGYLPYMVERYIDVLGYEGAVELLEANERPIPETIRCNDYLIRCKDLVERLEEKGYSLEKIPFLPHGFKVTRTGIGSIGGTHEYLLGYYYVQDPASMSIVYSLDPRPGELVIDMAAAPGGKSTQILQLTRDESLLVAVEKSPKRIKSLRSNLQRMRFNNYIIVKGDSLRVKLPKPNRVLVDAPSTGEGVIRKDPARKKSRGVDDLVYIHGVQIGMLERAIKLLRENGGVIMYSACTLAPEEGELVVDYVLEKYDFVEVVPHNTIASEGITEYLGIPLDDRVRYCGRFWPHIHDTEGFFLCKLRVSGGRG
ncbi:MAG: RsmB/NOP family class I SAM-dependent RNA methyltransferase [Desulfurococcales archaeon]|nr:RsmB/NOP family class I SAM-dependent RNA methyltransferase [Desulfurococcales archaeon]